MKVSKRQRQIIEMLLSREEELTVAEIARDIQVSSRTVHRELLEIEAFLETSGISLTKKAGFGIRLNAGRERLERLREELFQAEPVEYTAEERKVLILCHLLDVEEPTKLFSLSHDLQAAIPTISNDLDELEGWVERSGMTLIRKRGYGVELAGTEAAKRRAVGHLAQTHLDDSVLFGHGNDPPADPMTRRLLEMVGKQQFFRMEKALWRLEEKYPTALTQEAYTHLLTRLSIAATRYEQGKRMKPGEVKTEELEERDRRRYEFFAEALQITLPPEEEAYMTRLLQDWEKGSEGLLVHGDMQQVDFVNRLIRYVEEELEVELQQDRSLKEGLLQHAAPALKRIRSGESIRNPLLSQIKKDYEPLFATVKSAVKGMALDVTLPDEEIGYLVMHFGAALERNRQFSRRVRALLVCTSGIGSSKLLAVRLRKEFPQIELLGHVSWFEAARIPEEDYDLVISTVALPLPSDQYIKLSPLLTRDEAERLRQFIQGITLKRIARKPEQEVQQVSTLELLRTVRVYAQEIVRLLEGFRIHPVALPQKAGLTDLRSLIDGICETVQLQHGVERIHDIAERLMQREKQSSQVIPHSGLALFHTRSEALNHPVLALFRYERAVQWQGVEGERVRTILLMLGPKEMEKETLEVLSEVSALLLEPDVIRRLEADDEESIKRYLSQHFEQFIKTKLEWREWK